MIAGTNDNVFYADNFDELDSFQFVDQITGMVCPSKSLISESFISIWSKVLRDILDMKSNYKDRFFVWCCLVPFYNSSNLEQRNVRGEKVLSIMFIYKIFVLNYW